MGVYEVTHFQIVCDGRSCINESTSTENEAHAKVCAREDGFVEVDGKWFCADCGLPKPGVPYPSKKKGKR